MYVHQSKNIVATLSKPKIWVPNIHAVLNLRIKFGSIATWFPYVPKLSTKLYVDVGSTCPNISYAWFEEMLQFWCRATIKIFKRPVSVCWNSLSLFFSKSQNRKKGRAQNFSKSHLHTREKLGNSSSPKAYISGERSEFFLVPESI